MSKLITTEDGYEIRLGQKNPSCYPCCFEGKVALCETCAYDGYCRDKIRYYRCRNYIKIKDDYDKNIPIWKSIRIISQ